MGESLLQEKPCRVEAQTSQPHCTMSTAIGCKLVLERLRCLQVGLGSGPYSWLGDSCLITVPSHGLCSVGAHGKRDLSHLIRIFYSGSQSYQFPTLMISLTFNYLFKNRVPTTASLGIRASTWTRRGHNSAHTRWRRSGWHLLPGWHLLLWGYMASYLLLLWRACQEALWKILPEHLLILSLILILKTFLMSAQELAHLP